MYFCGLKGMMPGILTMLEGVCKVGAVLGVGTPGLRVDHIYHDDAMKDFAFLVPTLILACQRLKTSGVSLHLFVERHQESARVRSM
jgi:hypothetical protein